MKNYPSRFKAMVVILAVMIAITTSVVAAPANVSAQLDPQQISLGESAQLTITVSGNSDGAIAPPVVPGLDISPTGQSSQFESINGMTSSTVSYTYQVTPQRAGRFTIPALSRSSQPLVLQVQPGNGSGSAPGNISGTPSLPSPAASGLTPGATRLAPDGAAFARLLLPKRELFVGETVPVEIQVGLRPGLVASLNGLPTLNGDDFTLNKLSPKPEQSEVVMDGTPYTLLTWHSLLAAVKPGDFPVTVETPLTVRINTAPKHRARMPQGLMDDSMFDALFNDPFFQNFFGGTTEKEITVASEPDEVKVLALPIDGRPRRFSGAVGKFEVSSTLSTDKCAAGDPITLRMKITGTGDFDRVNTSMLGAVEGWKTYKPSAKFVPADNAGYGGEKDFEQAVIPMQPGKQTLPTLAFSFFDPESRRYETRKTEPLILVVSPSANVGLTSTIPVSNPAQTAAVAPPTDGLRPDCVETGHTVATLQPLYFQSWFVGAQGALVFCFAGALILFRTRERQKNDSDCLRKREASSAISICLAEMDAASCEGDVNRFFQSARAALQEKLAEPWHVEPASITVAEIDARLNGEAGEIRRVFTQADQAAYSGQYLSTADFKQWKEIVRDQLKHVEEL